MLLALAQPPLDLPVLAFLGLVPFALFIHRCGPDPRGRLDALRGAVVLGAIHFGLTLHWIPLVLARQPWLGVVGYVGVVAGLTGVVVGVGWVLWTAVHRVGAPLWVALPVAWTAGEWLRGHLPGGLALPWLELGVSLSAFPRLAGAAELVGSRGLGFWMALVGGLVAASLAEPRGGAAELYRRRRAGLLGVALLLAAAPMAWGVWRAATLELRPAARVAVVQPGVGAELRLEPEAGWRATRRALDGLTPALASGRPELVVLPEVVVRGDPRGSALQGAVERLGGLARDLGAPVVFGALGREPTADGDTLRLNSAFVATGDGLTPFRYDKRRLVPGVERTPLGMEGLLPGEAGFAAGRGAPLVRVGALGAGILICYESLYPELARGYREAGADILLNLTNDAWFGGEAPETRTVALRQHPAHLVLRAIENRVGVARAAATGISFFVDPLGRVHRSLPPFGAAAAVHDPGTTGVRTLYTRFGDVAGTGSAMAAVLLLMAGALRGGGQGRRGGTAGAGWDGPPPGGASSSLDPNTAGH